MNEFHDPSDLPGWLAFALRWLKRLGLLLGVLVVMLVVLEGLSYLFYPGHSTRFLLSSESNGKPAWIDNQFFPYRFYPSRTAEPPLPIVALKEPAEETLRVCLLGGSVAMGKPDPSFGVGRQLELMLQARYPDQAVEVINMSLHGGNTHVLREVARDLKRLKPDAVVVLTGNEEVAGPYGPASDLGRFHHSSRIARLMTLFSRTQVSQLFISIINHVRPARGDLNAWRNQEPTSLQGRMGPQDPRLKTVFRSFRKNLDAILEEAQEASPVVIVCTVPVNLRDCAPFSTSYLRDETAAQKVREELREAIAAEASTNRIKAARLYGDIIRRNPSHAEALFRAGRMALEENHTAEAAALFSRARDTDAIRLRADSRLNAIIRECAGATDVSLLDVKALFAVRSPQGIPGRELFLDHIHYTFEANHLLASALLDRMEFLHAFDAMPSGRIPDVDAMATELLYTPWGRADQLDVIIDEQIRPPFRNQLNNDETLQRLKMEKKLWDARVKAISHINTQAIFARRQASRPDDNWLAARAAWYLIKANAAGRAEVAADIAYEDWPHRFDIRALLALSRSLLGEDAQKGIDLICGTDGDTGYYDVRMAIGVGTMLLEKQQVAAARPWLEYAVERDQWNSEAAIALSKTLYQLDESDQAVGLLQQSIERNPHNPLLWEEMASLYCLVGRWSMATRCFLKSEELAPYRYERLFKWADALVRLRQYGRAQGPIDRYLAAIPDDPVGLALQATILSNLPPKPEKDQEPVKATPKKTFPWE